MRWFKQRGRGYHPLGLERSAGLAALARQHSGCEVLEADFEQFDFAAQTVEALVLIGALVHIPPAKTPAVLGRMLKALKPGGFVQISMKAGRGSHQEADGRIFHLWSDHALRHIFDALHLTVRDYFVSARALKTAETWHGYVLEKGLVHSGPPTEGFCRKADAGAPVACCGFSGGGL